MNKGKSLAALIAVLLVVIGAYIVTLKINDSKQEEQDGEEEQITIYETDKDTVSRIVYSNEHGEFNLVKEGEEWIYENDKETPIDQTEVSSMLTAISNIKGKVVAENTDEFGEYGLDKPGVKVSIDLNNGETTSFYIGNEVPTGGNYYLSIVNNNNVYLVDTGFKSSFGSKLSSIIITPTIPQMDVNYLTYLLVENKEGKDLEINYITSGDEADLSGYYEWFITKPYPSTVVADIDLLTEFFNELVGITFTECVEYNCNDFLPYGFEEPNAVITFGYYEEEEGSEQYEYKAFKLYIGSIDEETGNYYVRMSGSYSVNLISASIVDKILNVNPFDYTLKLINLINIETVEKLDIELNGNVYEMKITRETVQNEDGEDETESTYYFNNKKIEESDFKSLYQSIISLKAIGEIDTKKDIKGEDYLKLTFHRNTSTNSLVEIKCITYDAGFYKLNINGAELFLVDKRAISELANTIETFE